jgi:hypothetical protein
MLRQGIAPEFASQNREPTHTCASASRISYKYSLFFVALSVTIFLFSHSKSSYATFCGLGHCHSCKGKNDCKGTGGCKTSDQGCKGKNTCKGKGGCATDGSKPPKAVV